MDGIEATEGNEEKKIIPITYAEYIGALGFHQHPEAPTMEDLADFVELLFFTEPALVGDIHTSSDPSLPPCWVRHPDIVERLVALYWMRKEAFSEQYNVEAIGDYYGFLDDHIVKWMKERSHCSELHEDPAPNLPRLRKTQQAIDAVERADEMVQIELSESWEKASPDWKEHVYDFGDPWAPAHADPHKDSPAPTLAYSKKFERPERKEGEDEEGKGKEGRRR